MTFQFGISNPCATSTSPPCACSSPSARPATSRAPASRPASSARPSASGWRSWKTRSARRCWCASATAWCPPPPARRCWSMRAPCSTARRASSATWRAYAAGARGQVRILASVSAMTESLADDVAAFLQIAGAPQHPGRPGGARQPGDRARRARGRWPRWACAGTRPTSARCSRRPYRSDHLCMVVPPGHPLAHAQDAALRADAGLRTREPAGQQRGAGDAAARTPRSWAARCNHRVVVTNFEAALRVVRAGLAISLVPREVARAARRRPTACASFRWPNPGPSAASSSAYRDAQALSPAAQLLVEHLASQSPRHDHPTTLDLGRDPRVLFLSARSAGRARASWPASSSRSAQAGALRDDVSTDEITPVRIMSHYDDAAGALSLHRLQGGRRDCRSRAGAVQAGGFAGDGGGSPLRQGLLARAQPRGREAGRHPAGDRAKASSASTGRTPTTSACSPPPTSGCVERIAARRGDPDRGTAGRAATPLAAAHPAQRRPAALRPGSTCARRAPATAGRRRAAAARCSRRSSQRHLLRHAGHAAPTRSRAKALRARRLALHPRVLHRHGGAHAARHARRAAGAARAGIASSCSRTTPRTWTRAPRTCRPAWCPTCAPCARRSATSPRGYGLRIAPHADRRGSRGATTAATSPASRTP